MHHPDTAFGRSARWELEENLHNLSPARAEQLAQLGGAGISAKRPLAQHHLVDFLKHLRPSAQLNGTGLWSTLALVALLIGLVQIYDSTVHQHIDETAEIDSMVLTDELPLNAYLEAGFYHLPDHFDEK